MFNIIIDIDKNAATVADAVNNDFEIFFQEDDVGAVFGDVGGVVDGDGSVGKLQRRGVVDAVALVANDIMNLELLDNIVLLFGGDAGKDGTFRDGFV